MNIIFEEVSENNVFLIQELAQKVWPQTFGPILSETQILYMMEMMYSTSSLQKQIANNQQFLIVKSGKESIGFTSFEIGYTQKPTITKLHKIYILPEYQSKGYGRKTIAKIATIATAHNCTILSLNVNRYNTSAIKSYEKLGFTITKTEDIAIGNGYLMEDYVMEKKLVTHEQ